MPENRADSASLERTLGLPSALAIGVGTMVGAGIFVFPGLAADRAGPAAIVSFMLGGGIALLVALCTAELATAMPAALERVSLVLYGLICWAVLTLRRRGSTWYQPSFRLPATGMVATVGALTSFGLLAFMQPNTLPVGGSILTAAGL